MVPFRPLVQSKTRAEPTEMQTLSIPSRAARRSVRVAFLESIERRLGPLRRGAVLTEWRMFMGRTGASPLRSQIHINRLMSAPGLLEWTRGARSVESEPSESRRLEILE